MIRFVFAAVLMGLMGSVHVQGQLIQGTVKPGAGPGDVEVWLKPNFTNSTQYLFQLGFPIAFPASASPMPTGLTNVTLDPGFVAAFGNNYSVTVNPLANGTNASGGAEKYFNIVLIRGGVGASNAQPWTAGAEFKVLTATFAPVGAPAAQVKLADYQDGGSDGQGNFYTQSGNSDFYVTANSVGNFYTSAGVSTVGGNAAAGFVQTNVSIPFVSCTAPGAPTISNITSSGADVSWTAVGGAVGYEYFVSTSATPPVAGGTATSATNFTASGLLGNTLYYVHVRTNCGSGFSTWTSTSFTTACAAPAAPVVSNITTNSADISWSAVPGVVGYEYAVNTSATPPGAGTATGGTSYSAAALTGGTTYYFHLRSNCGAGNFSSWVSVSFNTSCPPPTAPAVANVTTTTADINWTTVLGAVGYEYAVTATSTPPPAAAGSGTSTTATSYAASGLAPATAYYAHVRSSCSSGSFSSWVSTPFTTQNPSCNAPSAPVVSNITTTTADISWGAVAGSVGYEYAVTTSAVPPGSGTGTTATSYSASSLTAGTQYYVHVRSNCGVLFSSWVSTPFVTSCPATTSPVVSSLTSSGATLTWTAVPGASGYEYSIGTSVTPPASGTVTAATSYSASSLTASTQYYFHVRTACAAGNYSGWVSVSFTTPAPCVAPASPAISNVTSTSADISWTAVPSVAGYEYAVTTSAVPPGSGTATTSTNYSATGLTPGTNYYIHLRSNCGTEFSPWASKVFTTVCPSSSGSVGVSAVTGTSATINWSAVAGASGYEYFVGTSATPPISGTATTATTYNATGLITGTQYYAHVRTACATGNFSAWVSVPFSTLCPATATPTVSSITGTGATINWSAVPGVGGYEYAVTTSAVPPGTGTSTTATSYSAAGLTGGTQYYVYVRSSCSAGIFSAWTSTSFTTTVPPCTVPSTPVVSNISSNATITWGVVTGAVGYEYLVDTSAGSPIIAGIATTNTTVTITGLASATQYYVHVRTVCGVNRFSVWVNKAFTTPCLQPVLTATVNGDVATINWNSVHGVVNYEYALLTILAPPLSGTATTDTFHTTPSLIPGATYYFHLRTYCGAGGISEWATVAFHTSGIEVYPNPVRNVLTINLYGTENGSGVLKLYDAAGKLVRIFTITGGTTTLDMRPLADGVYLMKYDDGKRKYMTKVMKM